MSPPSAADAGCRTVRAGRARRRPVPRHQDSGSAIVDFVLVGALTTVLFAAVLQLALALHVRSTLVDCAAEGARYGALTDRSPADGAERTRELIEMSVSPRFAQDVRAEAAEVDGLPVVRVEVRAALPLVGLIGPGGTLEVAGHALREGG